MFETIQEIFGVGKKIIITDEYEAALKDFEQGKNIFITGKAGTGKSAFIEHVRRQTKKNIVVLAPTGLAAVNIGGQTLHSFFKLPPRLLTGDVLKEIKYKSDVLTTLDAIIIDEASMVRADVLDGIDFVLRKFGKNNHLPFGGVQVVLVGDLFQLPPVVTNDEKLAFLSHYSLPYFFGSDVYLQTDFVVHELTQVFRQHDERFIHLLNLMREGQIDEYQLEEFDKRVLPKGEMDGSVLLAPTNRIVQQINSAELAKLPGSGKVFLALFSGEFNKDEANLPTDSELWLKEGARVMFVKNSEEWVNGSLGRIEKITNDSVIVKLDATGQNVEVGPDSWEKIVYTVENGQIEAKTVGSMAQLPLRLAWAVTIHKSQGQTFDQVRIDLTTAPFAHGQTYVALSRCKSLAGISLSRKLRNSDIIVDEEIINFLAKNNRS